MVGPRRLTALSEGVLGATRDHLPAGPALVALSGGADSAVCAWAAKELGSPLRAVFVHHGLPPSDAMEKAAGEVALSLAVPLDVVKVSIPDGPSPEAQARNARYAAMEAELQSDEWLLTGHTADDQAETVLANLIRGTGLRGLGGISRRRGRIVRPLLSVWRRQTRELATLLGLGWRDDPTNFDERTPRNAVRLSVLPSLERAFNPALRQALVRLAAQASRDDALLDELAAAVPITKVSDGEVRVPAAALGGLPLSTQERLVRSALRLLHPPYGGSDADVRAALAASAGAGSRQIGAGVEAVREGPWLVLVHEDRQETPEPVPWRFRGEVRFGRWKIDAWADETLPAAYPLSAWRAVFDADLIPEEGEIRTPRPGDVISMETGHKSVRAALSEADVPQRARDGWPVVAVGDDIVWVPGVRRAQQNWVTLQTRRYLWMRAEQESQ